MLESSDSSIESSCTLLSSALFLRDASREELRLMLLVPRLLRVETGIESVHG